MQQQTVSSGFPEIRVPALLTFLALLLGFVIGTVFRGQAGFEPLVWPLPRVEAVLVLVRDYHFLGFTYG